jgi:MFS family permease
LRSEWTLSESTAGWLTIAVQLGFVAGTLLSAFLNLPDVFSPRHLVASCAVLGAGANAAFGYFAEGPRLAIALRFLTGMFLAGVYPPGMKILATWFRRSRGMALGVLVGALTLGKASSYLINGIGSVNWRTNMLFISFMAAGGGLVTLLFVDNGPFALAIAPFDWRQVIEVFKNRGVRLASFGYFGHMWELYAMWVWAPVMIRASVGQGNQPALAEVASFLVIGCGAIGCVVAGLIADRVGRTIVTSVAMAISGSCCLFIGFLFGGNPVWILIVAAIWGATIVADSAQFSTCVTELGKQQYLGYGLTILTFIGFVMR